MLVCAGNAVPSIAHSSRSSIPPSASLSQICTCGRHHCPVHFPESEPFDGRTTAGDNFKAWEHTRTQTAKPKQQYVPNTAKFYGDTTSASAHVAHDAQPVRVQRKVQSAAVSDAPFDGRTTASDNFKAWEHSPRATAKPKQQYTPNTAKFYGDTTSATTHVPHEVQSNICPASLLQNQGGSRQVKQHAQTRRGSVYDLHHEDPDSGHIYYDHDSAARARAAASQ